MMLRMLLLLLLGLPLCAQEDTLPDAPMQSAMKNHEWKLRASLTVLNDTTRYSERLAVMPAMVNDVVVNPAVAVHWRERWTIAGNAVGMTDTATHTKTLVRVKEAYTALTLGDADLLVGRRLLRWGTGYAFTAAGVLDPPRDPANPGDRLNMNAGRDMVLGNYIHQQSAVTAVWSTAHWTPAALGAQNVTAVRYNTLLHGCDASLLYAHDAQHGSAAALTGTRVLGQGFELHGELAWRDGMALLLGAKTTTRAGITWMGEYFTAPANNIFLSSPLLFSAGRPQYAYGSVGKSRLRELPEWKQWDLTASFVARVNDRSGMVIVDATRRFGNHSEAYLHAAMPAGSGHSEYGGTPYVAATSMGVRLHL